MNKEEIIKTLQDRIQLDRKIRDNKVTNDYEEFCENECRAIERYFRFI